jgi:hypothetical protein
MQAAGAVREEVIEQDALIDLVAVLVLLQIRSFRFDGLPGWNQARHTRRSRIGKIINPDMMREPGCKVFIEGARVGLQETVPARPANRQYVRGELLPGGAPFWFWAEFREQLQTASPKVWERR